MSAKVEQLNPRAESSVKGKLGYVRELKEELKKVTWTTKDELVLCTKIVVGATFMFGLGIYLADLTIKAFLNGFGSLLHWIFG
jgi:preprotein translocase subunit SecE